MLFALWLEKVAGYSMGLPKGLSLTNLSIYFLLIAWSLKLITERKPFDRNNLNWTLCSFIFIMLISVLIKLLIDELPGLSLKRELFKLKQSINPYLIFFIAFNTINDIKTCKRVLLGLIIFLAATLATAILQKFGIAEISSVTIHRMGRASGWGNANAYASYLVLFFPLVLSYLLFRKNRIVKLLYGGLFIMAFIGLLITGSRGGMISLLFSMSVYILLLKQKIRIPLSRIIISILAIVVIAVASLFITPKEVTNMVVERFASFGVVAEEEDEYDVNLATGQRFILWESGLKLYFERPLFGHGHDTVALLMNRRYGIDNVAHNQFINYLIQYGFLGCAVYIFIHLKIFQHVRHHLNKTDDPWNKYFYISYIAGISGWLFSMLGVQLFLQTPIFWLYTAVMYKFSILNDSKKENILSTVPQGSDSLAYQKG